MGGGLNVNVQMTFQNPPEALARETARATREAMRAVARYHWRHRIPLRFQLTSAQAPLAQQLGFEPRTKAYEIRKAKTLGHRRPLVLTGGMEQAVTSTFQEPRATRRSGRVTATLRLFAPFYVRFRGRSGTGPDMRAELSAITEQEAQQYAEMTNRNIQNRIRRMRERRRSR